MASPIFVPDRRSFVRSLTMDKWKDEELERMKAGGNGRAQAFFESQPDYRAGMPFEEKYHSKAAGAAPVRTCQSHPPAQHCCATKSPLRRAVSDGARPRRRPATTSLFAAHRTLPSAHVRTCTRHRHPVQGAASASASSIKPSGSAASFGNGMTVTEVSHSRDQYFENLQVPRCLCCLSDIIAGCQCQQARRPAAVAGCAIAHRVRLSRAAGGKYGGFGSDGASHTMKPVAAHQHSIDG